MPTDLIPELNEAPGSPSFWKEEGFNDIEMQNRFKRFQENLQGQGFSDAGISTYLMKRFVKPEIHKLLPLDGKTEPVPWKFDEWL